MASKNVKISFCIVCMNRLHQLRETLLTNIIDNLDYDNVEFLILNYNSQDGMDEWIKKNMSAFILTGKINYYHTTYPTVFNHSHSKNLAFKLASGDIVCNINADHFTGIGFAKYVNEQFKSNDRIVLTTIDYFKTSPHYLPEKDLYGKVCVKKNDFLRVHGFDERMKRYGFEDWDFVNRLELDGCKRIFIEDSSFLRFIPHTQQERYSLSTNNIFGIYIQYLTPSLSEIVFLFRDGIFEIGKLVDNSTYDSKNYKYSFKSRNYKFEFSLRGKGWMKGTWSLNNVEIQLNYSKKTELFEMSPDHLELRNKNANIIYYKLCNSDSQKSIIEFKYFYQNRRLMEANLASGKIKVNVKGFGKASL